MMQPDISSKAARRQIAEDFKERKVPRGVFVIRCAATGEGWVGSSANLDAAKNSLWFQLRGGLSRHASLQQAWRQNGEDAFSFEVLEQFADDTPDLLLHDLLKTRKQARASSINAPAI